MGGGGYPWTPLTDAQKAGGTSPFRSAESVLTSPNDLDLGMLEALGITPGAARPAFQGASWGRPAASTGTSMGPTSGPSLGGPLGPAPAPGSSDPGWFSQMTGGTPSTSIGWDMQDAATRSSIFRPVTERIDRLDAQADDWSSKIDSALGGAWNAVTGAVGSVAGGIKGVFEEPSVWTGERPTVLEGRGVNPAQAKVHALGGSAAEAERYISGLQAQGDDAGALQFAEMYAEDTGVDLFGASYDPSGPVYDDAGEKTPATSFAEMSPTDKTQFQDWYNSTAVQEHYSDRTTFGEADPVIFKDFAAVQHFVSTLPSAAEVEAQAVKDVTQAEVDAYLKELAAMSDEDYNQIAKNLGLGPGAYKTDGTTADKKFLEEGNIRAHESGSGFDLDPSADPFSTFTIDNEAILKQVAAAKAAAAAAAAAAGGGDAGDAGDGGDGDGGVDAAIVEIFGELVTEPQHAAIRTRMAELGTTDLTQAIRNEFATITTPDYSADILQRYDEMGTALSDAAAERSRVLGETTTRAEGRIGEIKTGLKSELESFEVGRVEQQTAIETGVIERTTKMETDLSDRLDDIRIALGDQVTSEFEEVAALAGTLTSSQATSSRDAISRLTQIGNMAAAARLSAPAELSAEALTALSDLEFKVENEISQGLADSQAQVKMQKASALLQETMRRGEFETEKQRALVESVLDETLRGTVYEDRTKEMLAQALMQEDQYVRQFNEGVDQQLAGAQLQNLFGTQDYERQLDMMNLNRDWQTADALQGRGWQTDDMTTARGWQEADYTKALADQRADAQTGRGWDLADASADASAKAAAALAAQPDMTKVLNKLRADFPDVPDQLYSVAMHIKDMDHNPPMAEARTESQDWIPPEGFRGDIKPIGGANPGWLVTEQVGDSEAEVYMKSLTEGVILSYDTVDGSTQRTPAMSAKDGGTVRAMVDAALAMDTQSDVMAEISGMDQEQLEWWLVQQGLGGSTMWDPTNPSGTGVGGSSNTGSYSPSAATAAAAGPTSSLGAVEEWWTQNVPGGDRFNLGGTNFSPQGFTAWLASVLGDKLADYKTGS